MVKNMKEVVQYAIDAASMVEYGEYEILNDVIESSQDEIQLVHNVCGNKVEGLKIRYNSFISGYYRCQNPECRGRRKKLNNDLGFKNYLEVNALSSWFGNLILSREDDLKTIEYWDYMLGEYLFKYDKLDEFKSFIENNKEIIFKNNNAAQLRRSDIKFIINGDKEMTIEINTLKESKKPKKVKEETKVQDSKDMEPITEDVKDIETKVETKTVPEYNEIDKLTLKKLNKKIKKIESKEKKYLKKIEKLRSELEIYENMKSKILPKTAIETLEDSSLDDKKTIKSSVSKFVSYKNAPKFILDIIKDYKYREVPYHYIENMISKYVIGGYSTNYLINKAMERYPQIKRLKKGMYIISY